MNKEIDDLQNKISNLSGEVAKVAEDWIFNSDFRRGLELQWAAEALHFQIEHYTRELRKAERIAPA